ncbi:MAG: tetratricopeptide repeat protein [Sandaracinaceae bacterium]|nr:tetratricopeptide repeat protein [Sandaracinaceae bacterium]
MARSLAQVAAARERGQAERAWALAARAMRRSAPDDGRAAIAAAEVLPQLPAEPTAAWRDRAVRVRDALEAFLAAAPEHPDVRRAGRARAWAQALAGEHEAAIERAAGAIGLQDREASTLLGRMAALAVLRDDLASARRALVAAHRAYPQDNATLFDLGAIELALGRPAEAAEHYGRILGRRPEDLDARRDLAGALVAAGRPDDAVELLSQAAERHPDVIDLWLELAHAALEATSSSVAEQAARQAIERLPEDDGRGHLALGLALAQRGDRAAAAAAFDETLRRDPGDLRAQQGLVSLREAPPPRRDAARQLAAP